MNKENILRVAAAIEHSAIDGLGFNMSRYYTTDCEDKSGHGCGTVACIAGWAAKLANNDLGVTYTRADEVNVKEVGEKYLGINYSNACLLFTPNDTVLNTDLTTISQEQAVKTLRNLAETGDVDWRC